jgi:DNA polymerase-3 subunit gamma/tau
MSAVDVRRLWPDVIQALNRLRKATWALVSNNAQVVGLSADTLTLGFTSPGLRDSFVNGSHEPVLKQAITDVVGADWKIEAIVDPGAQPGAGTAPQAGQASHQQAGHQQQTRQAPPAREPEPPAPPMPTPEPPAGEPRSDAGIAAARGAIQQTRHGGDDRRAAEESRAADLAAADAEVRPDDQSIEEEQLGGAELLQRELGAQMIEEIRHQ